MMSTTDDLISDAQRIVQMLHSGRDGYLSYCWVREYRQACDFLVRLGVCVYTCPAVGGIHIELKEPHP